jgi:CRISP-associated protein Cas1
MPNRQRPHGEREPVWYTDSDRLSVSGGALLSEKSGVVPVEAISALLLGPGSSITSDAISLAAGANTAIYVVGEEGVRWRGGGRAWGASSGLAEQHATLWVTSRLDVARTLFEMRWGVAPSADSLAGIRGEEGAKQKAWYHQMAAKHGVRWDGRRTDGFGQSNMNDALSWAGTCVNALAATATHAIGAVPQLGFLHGGGAHSFCYDVADLHRNLFTAGLFEMVAERKATEQGVRHHCRDLARSSQTISAMIAQIRDVFERHT